MLPKIRRAKKADFIDLKTRVVYRGLFVDVAETNLKGNLFSCVISKKAIKGSVGRNKTRRRIYSIINKEKINTNNLKIIYPKKDTEKAKFEEIKSEIIKSLK